MHGLKEGAPYSNYILGTVAEVMDMPCPHAEWIRAWWETGRLDSADDPDLWGLVAACDDGTRTVCFEFYLQGRTVFSRTCELVLRTDEPGHAGNARILHPQWIHPMVARSWYSKCLDEHGDHCHNPSWTKLQPRMMEYPKWLIDVGELCVVPFSPATTRYLTLSYTWGQVPCLKASVTNIERLRKSGSLSLNQSPGIPQTVRDAIRITEFLGERYLWVDSLCIIQDDEAAFSRDLNAMHLIYANSILCLVALAGTDANHGLRGIQGVSAASRSIEQVTLDMDGGERLSHFKIPCPLRDRDDPDIPPSPGTTYIERGWTYQEFAFAPRRLVFTDGPLRWRCQCVKWGEEQLHEFNFDYLVQMPYTYWMQRRCPSLANLVGPVAREFNTRHFRFQGDTLRAFLGIQNYLNGLFLGGLKYGLPELFFDIALAWRPRRGNSRKMTRRVTQAETLRAEDCIPSWSWMSWQGDFEFIRDGEFDVFCSPEGCVEPIADWFAAPTPMPRSGEMRLIKCRWFEFKALAEDKTTPVPRGWIELEATRDGKPLRYRLEVPQEAGLGVAENDPFFQSRYPVPIPSIDRVVEQPENLRFLFSRTTRAFLCRRQPRSINHDAVQIDLYSSDGEAAGRLFPHQPADIESFLSFERVELVAVVKGWTTELHDLTEPRNEKPSASGNISAVLQHTPPGPSKTPLEAQFEDAKRQRKAINELPRRSCYFVLCVMWQNGWATRQASGIVLAEVWERINEPVDLILG